MKWFVSFLWIFLLVLFSGDAAVPMLILFGIYVLVLVILYHFKRDWFDKI